MRDAAEMLCIHQSVIKIHIDIVTARLEGAHLAVTKDMLQGVTAARTLLVAVDCYFCLIDMPVSHLVADNLVFMLHQLADLLIHISAENLDVAGACRNMGLPSER